LKEAGYSVLDDGRVIFRYQGIPEGDPFEVTIRCPLPSKLHEQHAAIRDRHRQWAQRFAIAVDEKSYQRYCDTRIVSAP
jgi:hypothetical protein